MGTSQIAAFLVFALVAAITPGPSNTVLTATGAAAGVARGLPCLFGMAAGMAAMMFAAVFGLGAFVLGYPVLVMVLKWAGALFLLHLAWKTATSPAIAATSTDEAPENAPDAPLRFTGFGAAFAFQWVNPKVWLVTTGAASAYLGTGGDALRQALWMGGLFFPVAFASGLVWLAFGAAAQMTLASHRARHVFNIVMGISLALSVVPLVA